MAARSMTEEAPGRRAPFGEVLDPFRVTPTD